MNTIILSILMWAASHFEPRTDWVSLLVSGHYDKWNGPDIGVRLDIEIGLRADGVVVWRKKK